MPAPQRPWDDDPTFELLAVPDNGYLSDPHWRDQGALFLLLGHHQEAPGQERLICVGHMPAFGVSIIHAKRNLEPLGYLVTQVAYKLTGPSEFEKPGIEMQDYIHEVKDLIWTHKPEMPEYPRPLATWGKEQNFFICSVHEIEEWIPWRNSGEFMLLAAERQDEPAVIIADVCQHMLDQLKHLLGDKRVRQHNPMEIAFRFLFGQTTVQIVMRRADFKAAHPQRLKFV